MPFLLKKGTVVPRSMGTFTDASGQEHHDTEGVPYREGEVVFEEDVSPPVLERIQQGSDWLDRIYQEVSDKEANDILGQQGKARRIPEHATEASVLVEAGEDVLSQEEKHEVYAEDEDEMQERVQPQQDADDVREALDLDPVDEAKAHAQALAEGASFDEVKAAPAQSERPQPRRRSGGKSSKSGSSGSSSSESSEGSG
jgi:hypothetical protein